MWDDTTMDADHQPPPELRRRRSDHHRSVPASESVGETPGATARGERPGRFASSANTVSAQAIIERFSSRSLSINSGLRVSALTVLAFSVLGILVWFLPGSLWTFGPLVALAGICVALGWEALAGVDLPFSAHAVLVAVSAGIPLAVALTADLASAVPLVAVAAIAITVGIFRGAPTPINRFDNGGSASPQGASSRRADRSTRPVPTTTLLASSFCALIFITGGTSWIALDALAQWAVVIPIACVIVAAVVWGDQIGDTYRAQSVWALLIAVVVGVAASLGMRLIGQSVALTPVVLPGIARTIGGNGAAALLGALTGVGVALSIIAVDGLLGDHIHRRTPLGALARGAAKFLVAAIPVYAMIRIGGI